PGLAGEDDGVRRRRGIAGARGRRDAPALDRRRRRRSGRRGQRRGRADRPRLAPKELYGDDDPDGAGTESQERPRKADSDGGRAQRMPAAVSASPAIERGTCEAPATDSSSAAANSSTSASVTTSGGKPLTT